MSNHPPSELSIARLQLLQAQQVIQILQGIFLVVLPLICVIKHFLAEQRGNCSIHEFTMMSVVVKRTTHSVVVQAAKN